MKHSIFPLWHNSIESTATNGSIVSVSPAAMPSILAEFGALFFLSVVIEQRDWLRAGLFI
jgi:hypothetical protein